MRNMNDTLKWFFDATKVDEAELKLWRECYPHRARYIAEEARAKVEDRDPDYPPPIAIG